MTFWLGVGEASFLSQTDVPLFIPRHRILRTGKIHKPLGPYCVDSGAFSEIAKRGKYTFSHKQYADECLWFRWMMPGMRWCAVMDHMCEPEMIQKKGKSVRWHQQKTTESYLILKYLAPTIPWTPVIQGYQRDEYMQHVDDYHREGIDLPSLPVVGLGSVCRREKTEMIESLVKELHGYGFKTHCFGMKSGGLENCSRYLESSDSMAWSFGARRQKIRLPFCSHQVCNNCLRYALYWRQYTIMPAIEQGMRERNDAAV